ncbi:MAG: glycosyltransferase [Chloroflexota bacterium]|nr:glycosyltransferase [Chloroflexota bacterium]
MKLLFLAPYPPYPPRGGGQQRMYQFIRLMARDHEVWLLSFSPNADATAELNALGNLCQIVTVPRPTHTLPKRLRTLLTSSLPDMALRGRSADFQRALQQLGASVPFDVVQAESIEMAQYGRSQPQGGPLWVYDAFNAEFQLQRRAFATDLRTPRKLPVAAYSFLQWRKLRRYERQLQRRFDGMFAVSAEDAAILQRLAPSLPINVVANGVDTLFFAPTPTTEAKHGSHVLFTGTLDFRPNIDALLWFTHQVWPLVLAQQPDARFVVVGRNPVAVVRELARERNVEIVGEVVDVRPWFASAGAYVVPMRIGGGVRLKLLEALAMAQPVVATQMGAEGIAGLLHGTHALLADQPAAFAAQLLAVIRDRGLAQRLGEAGRALVVEHYDWQAIVPRMTAAWEAWRERRNQAQPKRA